MRSGKIMTRKISAVEVNGHAKRWIEPHLKFQDAGPKCKASVVLGVLLIAASKLSSIFAACRDLANAPTDQAIRNALNKQLPEMAELERRLNAALATPVPNIVFRRQRDAAIDRTLIPYHGQPHQDPNELYHSLAKSGTTKFHAYATLYTANDWDFVFLRRFSCGEASEFLCAGGSGGGEGREAAAAFGGELVTVGHCHIAHQTMIHEQSQETRDASGLTAMFDTTQHLNWVAGEARAKSSMKVSVTLWL